MGVLLKIINGADIETGAVLSADLIGRSGECRHSRIPLANPEGGRRRGPNVGKCQNRKSGHATLTRLGALSPSRRSASPIIFCSTSPAGRTSWISPAASPTQTAVLLESPVCIAVT